MRRTFTASESELRLYEMTSGPNKGKPSGTAACFNCGKRGRVSWQGAIERFQLDCRGCFKISYMTPPPGFKENREHE